ncbi:MAG: hypothetical protein AAGA68_20715 [Pseudomonadota bacterium]
MIVHRVNSPLRAASVRRLASTHHDLRLEGRAVRWGAEMDLQAVGGDVLVTHGRSARHPVTLGDVVADLPPSVLLVLELKPSMSSEGAIASVLEQVAGYSQPIVFASFDHRLLESISLAQESARTALMTWQLGQGGSRIFRLGEALLRLTGVWPAFPTEPLSVSTAAYPWTSATPALAGALRDRGVDTLCGTVDSPEALAHVATIPAFGFFTDQPEQLIEYLRQHP